MITKIRNELRQFEGDNKVNFIISAIWNLPRIIKDRTLLTMKFVTPMYIQDYEGKTQSIETYSELCFHTYDYSNITDKIKHETLLLDIGAHFGEVTYRFLKQHKGYAYMFEINPNNQKVIKNLFKENGLSNYKNKLLKFGLGIRDKDDLLVLKNPLSYEGSLGDNKGIMSVPVKIKSLQVDMLDRYDRYKNIFVSLDVEGEEFNVLLGMDNFIRQVTKDKKHIAFFIEIKDKQKLNYITCFLKSRLKGLKVKKITKEDYLFSNYKI